jgi:hypothetical protein
LNINLGEGCGGYLDGFGDKWKTITVWDQTMISVAACSHNTFVPFCNCPSVSISFHIHGNLVKSLDT